MSYQRGSAAGFTLAELVVCTAIAGMAFVFTAPALDKGRAGTDRLRCENNLRILSQAHLMYANDRGGFPPMAFGLSAAGQAQGGPGGFFDNHGWYSLIGPYIGEPLWASYIDLSVSMSHPRNERTRRGGLRLKVHACPADIGLQRVEWQSSNWSRVRSNYIVNAGNTNYGQTPVNGVAFLGAPFGLAVNTPLMSVVDGLSNTLLMSEVVVFPETLNTWGGTYSETQTALGGHVFTGFNPPNSNVPDNIGYGIYGLIGEAAATALFAQQGIPLPVSASPSGALTTYIAPRSKHPGGFNASLCDGSAGLIANGIDPAVWRALSSARGSDFVPANQASSPTAKTK